MKTTARSVTAERYLSLRAIRTLVRWDEWYDSKVPLLFICFYQMCLVQPIPARQVIVRLTLVTAFACLYLAFGYLINDYSDRETDRLAGKLKLIASLPAPAAVVLLCLLGLAGMAIPLFLIGNRVLALGLTAVAYFFAAFYSMPPVRFKERGVWGLVVSAVAQRSLPALIIFAAFDHFGLDSWLLFALLALIGVRWILVHQLIDLQNDREAGVSTFAAHAGRAQTEVLTKWVVFPLEVVCLIALCAYGAHSFSGLWFIPLGYGLVVAANWALWRGVNRPYSFTSYSRQPLSDLYYFYWPIGLALALAFREPVFWLILAFNIAWQGPYLLRHGKTARRLLVRKLHGGQREAAARTPER